MPSSSGSTCSPSYTVILAADQAYVSGKHKASGKKKIDEENRRTKHIFKQQDEADVIHVAT